MSKLHVTFDETHFASLVQTVPWLSVSNNPYFFDVHTQTIKTCRYTRAHKTTYILGSPNNSTQLAVQSLRNKEAELWKKATWTLSPEF